MENRTIESLEEKLRQAMLTSDVSILDELIADDLVFTMHTGQVVDKQYDLEAHQSGIFKFTKLEVSDAVGTAKQTAKFMLMVIVSSSLSKQKLLEF